MASHMPPTTFGKASSVVSKLAGGKFNLPPNSLPFAYKKSALLKVRCQTLAAGALPVPEIILKANLGLGEMSLRSQSKGAQRCMKKPQVRWHI